MNNKQPKPGISREPGLADEALLRLEKHLKNGSKMTLPILKQWIKRYGEPARMLIRQYDQYSPDME